MNEITAYNLRKGYFITENGEVFSKDKIIKSNTDHNGYLQIRLYDNMNTRKSLLVHRLVAITFLPVENFEKLTVNHIDGNKLNNNYSNLEWMPMLENTNKAKEFGFNGGLYKYQDISIELVKSVIDDLLQGEKVETIMKKYNVSENFVSRIKQKKRWSCLTKNLTFPRNELKKYSLETIKITCYYILQGYSNKKIYDIMLNFHNTEVKFNTINNIINNKTHKDIFQIVKNTNFKPSETIETL